VPLDRLRCPVCMDLVFQPVQLPCRQCTMARFVCLECVEGMRDSGNTWCPFCKLRFSTRGLAVHKALAAQIERRFPGAAARRANEQVMPGPCASLSSHPASPLRAGRIQGLSLSRRWCGP
jgi:hypothetical protein